MLMPIHIARQLLVSESGESGAQAKWISLIGRKKEDATDRRVSLLSLTLKGERLVDEIIEQVRPINDIFFGGLHKGEFEALSAILERLVESSRNAIIRISSQDQETMLSNRDKMSNPDN